VLAAYQLKKDVIWRSNSEQICFMDESFYNFLIKTKSRPSVRFANEKAMELSFNVIVVGILVMITLVVVLLIFGGGAKSIQAFFTGMFSDQDKHRQCIPGPGEDANNDGWKDSGEWVIRDANGKETSRGPCTTPTPTK